MSVYLSEFLGTMVMILLGDGVVAGVLLKDSKAENAGWGVITWAWGLAVLMGIFVAAKSGAHMNPAITLALASIGKLSWSLVPGYIAAQMAGAFTGAVLVYLTYLAHWGRTPDPTKKLGVFCTIPAVRSLPANIVTEVIGTFVLVYCVLAIGSNDLSKGLAPIAVACFMFNLAALFGWDLLIRLSAYVGVVLLALGIQMFVVFPILLATLGRKNPLAFFRETQEASVMAFSTASSNATLPTSLRVADEELKLPPRVARFVLTIGATANQNGTAMFEGVTVIFLAQFFGVELSLAQQATVMFVCILGGIGTAGVPAGSLPVVALICGMVGVPPEGIGLILGVDRFLDMCRTTLNVTGDLMLATVVSSGEDEAKAA